MALDSQEQIDRFLANSGRFYHVWPPKDGTSTALSLIGDFYNSTREVPDLRATAVEKKRAHDFLASRVRPNIPVVIQMGKHSVPRTDSWKQFFELCRERFPVKFVIVCEFEIEEIDPSLRSIPNVIVSRDHYTTLEQDLAIIEASAMYLASHSAMNVRAIFGEVPYSIIDWSRDDPSPEGLSSFVRQDEGGFHYAWSTPHQRLIPEPLTTTILFKEFERLFATIDVAAWRDKIQQSSLKKNSLRLW
jgi:hypothetical protein